MAAGSRLCGCRTAAAAAEGDGGKGVGEVLALSLNVKAQALSSFWVDHSKAANGRLAGRSVGGRGWQP